MTTIQLNKFNVIQKLELDNINYVSVMKNYLENTLESNINIYHPDYIYQMIWSNKINYDELKQIYDEAVSNVLIQKRQNIRNLIKKEKFDLSSLITLINNFNTKLLKLENILLIKNNNIANNVRSILSDPILINYLETEFLSLDSETVSNIQKLTDILHQCPTEDYHWFLKLIGHVLRNNIVPLSVSIPDKYKYFYELTNTIEYAYKVTKMYKFLNESVLILLNPIYEIILSQFINCINCCNIIELLNLINNKALIIKKIFKDDNKKLLTEAISNNFQNHIANIETFDYNKIILLLQLVIKCKNLDLLESYIFLMFENEKIINCISDIIHDKINDDPLTIKNMISLLKIKNKDQFMDKYHKLLIERILSGDTVVENERKVIIELQGLFGPKITNKCLKVINDYSSTLEDNKQYKIKCGINNFNTVTTSYSNWDINYNQGYVTINSILPENNNDKNLITKVYNKLFKNDKIDKVIDLESYISNYQNYYNLIYSNKRKLLWLLQYGEIDITYEGINIKLLPIQLMVLELFNVKYAFTFERLIDQSFFANYSNKFKEDIVNSLVNGNILIKNNDKIYLNENNKNISTNLIDVYLNGISENRKPLVDTTYELAHDREDIVKSLINHNVKINSINKDQLFTKLQNDITVFQLTDDIFNNSINKMVKYDYITIENNIISKCVY